MHWSRGELTAMPGNSSQGVVLLRLDDDVYALPRGSVYRARATLMFGTPADDQQLDVTETLSDLTVNRRDTQQIAFTLDNGSGWIDDSLVSSEVTLAAVLKTGFWYDGAAVLQTIGVFELDSINPSEDQPDVLVKLTGRDRFAWLSSKSESEQFVNWLPQGIGVDEYVDATVTGYGGMGHTAIEDGAWKAYGNKLRLTSNNERGVANSTFLYDCWNGAVQAHFALASEDNSEYAGLVFRAQDKDNQYIYRYDQDDDKLHLYQVAAGIETELWASSAKSWGAIASRFLRADFRYSRIRLYSSDATPAVNALVDWSLEQSLLVDGHSTNAALESGYVGVLGLGFSDLDAWAGSPDPVPVGALPGDYPEFVPPEGPVDPAVEAAFSFVVNGQNVKFTDLSYTIPGDTIVSWNWSFSDSRSTTTQSPRVGFPIGSYTATLTVVTALGSTNSVTQSFSVTSSGWITEVNFADAGAQGWNSMAQYPTTLEAGKGWLVGVDDAGGVYIDLPYAVSFSQVNFHYLWSAPTHPNPAPFYNRAAFASYTDDFANDYTNVYYDLIFWAYGHSTTGGLPGNDPSDPTDGEGGGGWLRSYNYPDKTTPQKTYSFHMTNNYNILYGEEDYRLWIQTLTFQGSGANPFEALDL